MKKHITDKQLDELSENGRGKLRKWWKPKEGDWTCWDGKEFCLGYIGYQKEYKVYFDLIGKRKTMDLAIIPELKTAIFDEGQEITSEFQTIRRLRLRGDLIGGEVLPLLSIGQMIEFIKDSGQRIEMTMDFMNDDICFELWVVVREVLNEA